MNHNEFKINHPAFEDVPEEILLAFLMMRDLYDTQDEFDELLLENLDWCIHRILLEIPNQNEILDLTDVIEVMKGTGKIKLKTSRSKKRLY